jgi:hypothetical protein
MLAVRQTYDDAPMSIPMPEEFLHQSVEVIFLAASPARSLSVLDSAIRAARGSLADRPSSTQVDSQIRAMRSEWQ